jgi:hypothetical protein
MNSNPAIVVIVSAGILNGIFSPFFFVTARVIITALAPALLITGPRLVTFFASLLAATATIILAGVPAALFERASGRRETDAVSYAIWTVTAVAISFPAVLNAAALLF